MLCMSHRDNSNAALVPSQWQSDVSPIRTLAYEIAKFVVVPEVNQPILHVQSISEIVYPANI